MTDQTLLSQARTRRLKALASLSSRQDKLFDIAEARSRSLRDAPPPMFASRRAAANTLSLVYSDDRLAA